MTTTSIKALLYQLSLVYPFKTVFIGLVILVNSIIYGCSKADQLYLEAFHQLKAEQYDSAVVSAEEALKYANGEEETIEKINYLLLAIYNNWGISYNDHRDFEKALEMFSLAMGYGSDETLKKNIAVTYGNWGFEYLEKEDYERARELLSQALNYKSIDGIKNNLSVAYNNLGVQYGESGDYRKAIELLQKAIEINGNETAKYNLSMVQQAEFYETHWQPTQSQQYNEEIVMILEYTAEIALHLIPWSKVFRTGRWLRPIAKTKLIKNIKR